AAYLARRMQVPYVLRPLGVLAPYGLTERRPRLKKLSLSLLERRLIRSASAMHFTSHAEASEAEALNLTFNGVVIPLGIDTEELAKLAERRNLTEKPRTLLYLSRIDPKKNLEALLRAFALV